MQLPRAYTVFSLGKIRSQICLSGRSTYPIRSTSTAYDSRFQCMASRRHQFLNGLHEMVVSAAICGSAARGQPRSPLARLTGLCRPLLLVVRLHVALLDGWLCSPRRLGRPRLCTLLTHLVDSSRTTRKCRLRIRGSTRQFSLLLLVQMLHTQISLRRWWKQLQAVQCALESCCQAVVMPLPSTSALRMRGVGMHLMTTHLPLP